MDSLRRERKNKTKTIIKYKTTVMVMMMRKTIIKERRLPGNSQSGYLPSTLQLLTYMTFLQGREWRMLSYKARPSSGWVSRCKQAYSPAPAPSVGTLQFQTGADEAGR